MRRFICILVVLLAVGARSAADVVSTEAEFRQTRWRLVQKPGYLPTQTVFAVSNRYHNYVAHLTSEGWARGAFPPINAILNLDVAFTPAPSSSQYVIEPFIVRRNLSWSNGLAATSTWFASPDSALSVGLFHLTNSGGQPVTLQVRQSGAFRVGYADAAQVRPLNKGAIDPATGQLVVVNSDFPDLFCKLRTNFAGILTITNSSTGQPVAQNTSALLGYYQDGSVTIPAGGQADYWIALTGGRTGDMDFAFNPTTQAVQQALARAEQWQTERIANAPKLETPNEDVNAFFLWNKIWPWRTEHDLPIGPPYLLSSRDNSRIRVMSAATGLNWDYYGIWANDCVQSMWECSALGHEFYPVVHGTLEAHFRNGAPESVELPRPDGRPFYVFLKLASKPEFVIGAANFLLWSAQQSDFEALWPDIRLTLQSFHAENDWDRDWLDDNAMWPFPEQPSVGSYNHEMLYAASFWYAAFDAASRAADLFGRSTEAEDLRWQRDQIGGAINSRFATDYGYASWLDISHQKHPHKGHNQSFVVQYGIAPPEQAARVFQTELTPPIVTDYGPRVGDMGVGDVAWVYNRWNMVHALYNYGRSEQAFSLLGKYAAQESSSSVHYQGPESFTPDGATTSQGLVWSSSRAMRAIYFGLIGISLEGAGVRFVPKPPGEWSGFSLDNLEVRGALINLRVQRGALSSATCDGQRLENNLVPNALLTPGDPHEVVVTLGTTLAIVSGHIRNVQGTALVGAKVELVGDSSRFAVSDGNGAYTIQIPEGERTLVASASGYRSQTRNVITTAGQVVDGFDFALGSVNGSIYYVATTGNDSNDGLTPETAWASIDKGDRDGILGSADRVVVLSGVYDISGAGLALSRCSGTPANPIVYQASGQVLLACGSSGPALTIAGLSGLVLEGFHVTGGSVCLYLHSVSNVEIRNCRFSDRTGGGSGPCVWLVSCGGCRLHHNVVGPNLPQYSHGLVDDSTLGGNRFYNNTIVGSTDWAFVLGGTPVEPAGSEFRNNVISGASNGIFTVSPLLAHSHNILHDVAGAMYHSTSAGPFETSADPMFVSPARRDYQLAPGSPAIDAGTDVGLPYVGAAPDLGAFEAGAAGIYASSIGDLKRVADGTSVLITGASVTSGSGVLKGDRIYLEDPWRAAGIQSLTSVLLPAVLEGDRVCLEGLLSTNPVRERVLLARTLIRLSSSPPLRPVTLRTTSIGERGISSGLLVRTAGRVAYVAPGDDWFCVDDGAGASDGLGHTGVAVLLGDTVSSVLPPPLGAVVVVRGLAGREDLGGGPVDVLRVRSSEDIVEDGPAILPPE